MSKHKIIGKSSIILLNLLLLFILNSLLVCATIDLYAPENNTHTNQQNITFEYLVSLNNTLNCTLILDSEENISSTNISEPPEFNQLEANLEPGSHTWSIICNSVNESESSEQRILTIDIIEPTVVLVLPVNNTQINSSSVDIEFIVVNTPEENSSCDIILNNSVNKSIIAEDSMNTTAIISGLSDGWYDWSITCYDSANNSETSETRIFRVNTTEPEPEPEFNISIGKTEYNIGENGLMTISAPNGTSIRVEVCPDKPGFVECEVPVIGNNIMNYPFQEYLPFTNYEGEYILEAYFNKSGFTETQVLNYKVRNNIEIDIDADSNVRENVPIILEAEASGGVGALNYTWHLSSGATLNKRKDNWVNITYKNKGNYTETVVVKDSYNNTRNKSINIDVSNTYYTEIVVKDSVTNNAIKGASVEVDDEQKQTDTNGKAYYYLKEGRREIIILKENYSIYFDELNITKNQTFTIKLEPLTKTEPKITLISPENNSGVTGTTTELVFKAEYNNTLNCSIYINENHDGFFIYLGSMKVSDKAEQRFGVIELDNVTYWWRVECVDNNDNSGVSKTWEFTVGNTSSANTLGASQQSEESKMYNDWVKEFEQFLDELEKLPKDDKEAADAIGIISTIKDAIKIFKNTIRDLDSINFRNDLSEQEKQAEKEKILLRAQEAYQRAPVGIEVLKSDSFVDYTDDEELKQVLDEYLEIKNITLKISKRKVSEFLDELQQEVVISTKTKNVRVRYKNDSQSDLTVIIREIKTYNLTPGTFILEIIPKDVAQKADETLSSLEYTVVKQDPVIRFELEGDTTLVYYFEKNIDLDLLKNIKTVVLIDPDSMDNEKITGFSTKGLKLPKLKSIIFIPIMIILLGGLAFVSIRYNGIDTAKYIFYKLHGHKSLHYFNVILNDINDNLDIGDAEKALSLYEEAKTAYSELSTLAKNDVYERVVEASDKIRSYCYTTQKQDSVNEIKEMIINIQDLLGNGQLGAALEEYKRIESAYNQLEEKTKEVLHPSLVSLGNKIQIIVDEGKNKI